MSFIFDFFFRLRNEHLICEGLAENDAKNKQSSKDFMKTIAWSKTGHWYYFTRTFHIVMGGFRGKARGRNPLFFSRIFRIVFNGNHLYSGIVQSSRGCSRVVGIELVYSLSPLLEFSVSAPDCSRVLLS